MRWRGKKIVVIGGSGFIGSHLTKRLLSEGAELRIIDIVDPPLDIARDVEFYKIDLLNMPEKIDKALEGVEIIFHYAAMVGPKLYSSNPVKVLDVNVLTAVNIFKRAVKADVETVVFPSSSEVYSTGLQYPESEDHPLMIPDTRTLRWTYAGSKIIGELYLFSIAKEFGINGIVIRYFNVYGPRQRRGFVIPDFIWKLFKEDTFTIIGQGKQTRCFCYVEDAINATLLAVDKLKNDVIIIGNDKEEVSINQLFQMLCEITGRKPKKVIHLPSRLGEILRRKPDCTKMRKILGYESKVPLREGLERTVKWYSKAFQAD